MAARLTIPGKIIVLLSAFISLCNLVLDLFFTVYDINSGSTKTKIPKAILFIILSVLWCSMSIYAHRLCHRLISTPSFIKSIRLHSKTVVKVPASILIAVLAFVVIVVHNYSEYRRLWLGAIKTSCKDLPIDGRVCQALFITKVLQSVLVWFYNTCAAVAVFSVCRTHTIGVRRFIRILEKDGVACDLRHRQKMNKIKYAASNTLTGLLRHLYLPEECYGDGEDSEDLELEDSARPLLTYRQGDLRNTITASPVHNNNTRSNTNDTRDASPVRHTVNSNQRINGLPADYTILSKDDILFTYWKLATRMKTSSKSLQRWVMFWMVFTILWLFSWILDWINHPVQYLELIQFSIPLLMFIILCTAYGEANQECERLIWSITPLQDRLDMIKTLPNIVVGMTIYNKPIEFSTIATFVAALVLALCSRLILDELS